MDRASIILKPVAPGQKITASGENIVRDAVNRLYQGMDAPKQVRASGFKVPVGIRQLSVVSVELDYLICNPTDGINVDEGQYIRVALPFLLRRSIFDGASRNGISYTYTDNVSRTADDGASTESQVVVPSYVAGDCIFAASGILGTTGVLDAAFNQTTWLDLNVDGRAWAKATA